MKSIYLLIIPTVILCLALIYQTYNVNKTIFEYEQEVRVQWEYLKGCEARMTYLDSVLEREGITVLE